MRSHGHAYLTAPALVKTGPGLLCSATLIVAAIAVTLVLYDNTTNSGAVIATLKSTGVANISTSFHFPRPIAFNKGLYASLSGSGGAVDITFE
jgi:hypothetical protein